MQNSQKKTKPKKKDSHLNCFRDKKKQMLRFMSSQQEDYTDYPSLHRTARIASTAAVDFRFLHTHNESSSFFDEISLNSSTIFATIFL